MTFEELPEYRRDLKTLLKNYPTLTADMAVVRKVLSIFPDEQPPRSFQIGDLEISSCVIKMKRVACRAFKGRGIDSGLRLVYAWFEHEPKMVLIQLYEKVVHPNPDYDRIKRYFK